MAPPYFQLLTITLLIIVLVLNRRSNNRKDAAIATLQAALKLSEKTVAEQAEDLRNIRYPYSK